MKDRKNNMIATSKFAKCTHPIVQTITANATVTPWSGAPCELPLGPQPIIASLKVQYSLSASAGGGGGSRNRLKGKINIIWFVQKVPSAKPAERYVWIVRIFISSVPSLFRFSNWRNFNFSFMTRLGFTFRGTEGLSYKAEGDESRT